MFQFVALLALSGPAQCGPAAGNVTAPAVQRTFTPARNLRDRFQSRRGLFRGPRAGCR